MSLYRQYSQEVWSLVREVVPGAESVRYSKTGADVKFLSLEPLLGPLPSLDLTGINWVIVGGESGPGARPMDATWVRRIRAQCRAAKVSFFFKQWGGVNKKKNGRLLDGEYYDAIPDVSELLKKKNKQVKTLL